MKTPEQINSGPLFEPPEGFPFTEHSAIRRFAEPAAFALFPYMAGITVMHDEIAAAVNHHSDFTHQPWKRLFGTINSAVTLVFGNEQESLAVAQRLWHFHETVRGNHGDVEYSANDASLQTWVLGSVFTGLEEARRRWSEPLKPDERADLYDDITIFGKVFGLPDAAMPPDVEAFDTYWDGMLDGDTLLQQPISHEMAQTVFKFRSPKVPLPITRLGQAVAIMSLDPRLQAKANLRPDQLDYRLSNLFDIVIRQTYGRLPGTTREKAIKAFFTTRRKLAPAIGRLSAGLERRRLDKQSTETAPAR